MQCNLFDLFQFTLILFVHLRTVIGYIMGKQEDMLFCTLSLSKRQFTTFFLWSELLYETTRLEKYLHFFLCLA